MRSCPADSFSAAAGSGVCTLCSAITAGATTSSQTAQTTCTCANGGTSAAAGGYYSNGLTGVSLSCSGTSRAAGPPASDISVTARPPRAAPCFHRRRHSVPGPQLPAVHAVQQHGVPVPRQHVQRRERRPGDDGSLQWSAPRSRRCQPAAVRTRLHGGPSAHAHARAAPPACPAGSGTYAATQSATCTCLTGGTTTAAGGFYSNDLSGDSLVCTGAPRARTGHAPRGRAHRRAARSSGPARPPACPASSYQPTAGADTCSCLAGGSLGTTTVSGANGGTYSNNGTSASLVCTGAPTPAARAGRPGLTAPAPRSWPPSCQHAPRAATSRRQARRRASALSATPPTASPATPSSAPVRAPGMPRAAPCRPDVRAALAARPRPTRTACPNGQYQTPTTANQPSCQACQAGYDTSAGGNGVGGTGAISPANCVGTSARLTPGTRVRLTDGRTAAHARPSALSVRARLLPAHPRHPLRRSGRAPPSSRSLCVASDGSRTRCVRRAHAPAAAATNYYTAGTANTVVLPCPGGTSTQGLTAQAYLSSCIRPSTPTCPAPAPQLPDASLWADADAGPDTRRSLRGGLVQQHRLRLRRSAAVRCRAGWAMRRSRRPPRPGCRRASPTQRAPPTRTPTLASSPAAPTASAATRATTRPAPRRRPATRPATPVRPGAPRRAARANRRRRRGSARAPCAGVLVRATSLHGQLVHRREQRLVRLVRCWHQHQLPARRGAVHRYASAREAPRRATEPRLIPWGRRRVGAPASPSPQAVRRARPARTAATAPVRRLAGRATDEAARRADPCNLLRRPGGRAARRAQRAPPTCTRRAARRPASRARPAARAWAARRRARAALATRATASRAMA